MSARVWKLGVAGLGALSLSCAAVETMARNSPLGETGALAVRTVKKMSDCGELRAKVSFDEERALGGAVALNWVAGGGGLLLPGKPEKERPLAPEEALQQYLNVVGRNLAAQSSRPTLPWTFGVLRATDAFNATSAPGGYVFVTRGLLQSVENEAQLAGVLAHEIAHITLQHALASYDEVKVSQCRVMTGGKGVAEGVRQNAADATSAWGGIFRGALDGTGALDLNKHADLLGHLTEKVVEKVVTDGYAEKDEFAADEQAVRLLVSAGYDPKAYIDFLDKLPKGRSNFAHHPKTSDRQRKLNTLLSNASSEADEFPELPATDGLKSPPLSPAFALVRDGK